LDRLDVEDRAGAMLAFGWVRTDGLGKVEAKAAVVRASVECLRDMLRSTDLLGRVAPTRIAAWCDSIDHLIALIALIALRPNSNCCWQKPDVKWPLVSQPAGRNREMIPATCSSGLGLA
jgi:hypothetical protein